MTAVHEILNNEGTLMKVVEINERKIKVASTIDAVGLFCPIPIVKLKIPDLERMSFTGAKRQIMSFFR